MKTKILVATTAAVMAAGTYYAVAQGVSSNSPNQAGPKPGQSPMERSAQNERGSGQMGQGGQMSPQGSGRADSKEQVPPGQSRPTTSGQAPSSAQQPSTGQTPGGSATTPQQRRGSDTGTQTSPSPRSGTQTAPGAAQQSAPGGSSAQSPAQQGGAAGGTAASLSTEQRTQIRQTVLAQSGAPRVNSVNFSLSVGTVVPRTVRVVVLPEPIVRIHPAWRGYMYFIVGDQIVIVEPGTLRIVAVLA
jgi:hypothetical protein